MTASRFLITGGAGFIGSNLAHDLLRRGHHAAIFDNFSTGRRENLKEIERDVEIITGDLRDFDVVSRAAIGRDFILHQGALPSVPRSVNDPVATNEVNVTGTLHVLLAARDAGVKRVVVASSSSVYGDTPVLPKVETMPVLPMSPYAVSKLAAEKYAAAFHRVYGLETVALRYFNVFGPRQDPTSQYSAVIPRFITAIQRGESPVIYGDGLQSRDFTFVANVVEANLLACQAASVAGEFFNVACGRRFTLLDVLQTISEVMGKPVIPRLEPARPGDVRHSLADVSKIRTAMDYEGNADFYQGLRLTVEHFTGVAS